MTRLFYLAIAALFLCSCATETRQIAQSARPLSLSAATPFYPVSARKQNQQGTVRLKVLVLKDGSLGDISIDYSSGYSVLDEAAIESLKASKWAPAVAANGQLIDSTLTIPITYNLKD